MPRRKLSPRQERFVAEYLIDLNAAAAYGRAGYKVRSPAQAAANAARLIANDSIAAAIAQAKAERAQRTQVTADRVVLELARIAFLDPRAVVEWGPDGVRLRPSEGLDEAMAAAVESVSETTTRSGGSLHVRFHSKPAALKILGDHLGIAPKKIQLSGPDGQPLLAVQEMTDEQLARIIADAGRGSPGVPPPPAGPGEP